MTRIHAGEKFPELTFNTYRKDNVTSGELIGSGKTVFWVLRYIGCTVCRYDVHMITERYSEFTAKNAKVVVVMQSDREIVRESLNGAELPFELICDTDQNVYRTLSIEPAESMDALLGGEEGLASLKAKGAKAQEAGFSHGVYEGNEQQLPAMFIVEADGTVSYAHYAETIMDMPNVDEVLAML